MIDLHLHLDGAISLANARALAKIQNIQIAESDEDFAPLLHVPEGCQSLAEFLTKFPFTCSFLQTEEGLSLCMKNLLEEQQAAGVLYTEIRYAPQLHTSKGLTQEDSIEILLSSMKKSKTKASLILCCMRGENTKEQNLETIRLAKKYIEKGVCALDLAGGELPNSILGYSYLFEGAKEGGVALTVHVGEATGADEVHRALNMSPGRIGHGIRSYEDPQVLEELADLKTPLEICITSNLQTQAINSLEDYPLRKLMDAGVIITLNTDDPGIEDTTLKKEWQLARRTFNLNKKECADIMLNSINAAFTSKETKSWLRHEMGL